MEEPAPLAAAVVCDCESGELLIFELDAATRSGREAGGTGAAVTGTALSDQIAAGVAAALEAAGVTTAATRLELAEAVSVALDEPPAAAVDSPA